MTGNISTLAESQLGYQLERLYNISTNISQVTEPETEENCA
jgi:hypothetical protein